jgi:hypothetical protein
VRRETVSDFLDDRRKEITKRLDELKPLAEEYKRLEAAVAALRGVPGTARAITPAASPSATTSAAASPAAGAPATAARKNPNLPPVSPAKAAASPAKRGRRKGSGVRAREALSFVQGQPGITIPELAAKMGIKQNYLYRVLPGLEEEGKLEKRGRGWHPTGA